MSQLFLDPRYVIQHQQLCQALADAQITRDVSTHLVVLLQRVAHAMRQCRCPRGQCRCQVTYVYDGPKLLVEPGGPLLEQLRRQQLLCCYQAQIEQGYLSLGVIRVEWR